MFRAKRKSTVLTDEMQNTLIQAAIEARKWAYTPYSNYPVGAALLTASGRIYDGVNVENAAYPMTMCAERVAVFKAVSEGEHRFSAIAVATSNGGSSCGACRQVLSEFGIEMRVLIVDDTGRIVRDTTIGELLPSAFGPSDLPRP